MPASTTSLFSLGVGAVLTFPVALNTAERQVPGVGAVLVVIALGLVCVEVAFVLYFGVVAVSSVERWTRPVLVGFRFASGALGAVCAKGSSQAPPSLLRPIDERVLETKRDKRVRRTDRAAGTSRVTER